MIAVCNAVKVTKIGLLSLLNTPYSYSYCTLPESCLYIIKDNLVLFTLISKQT
jgi:hypothetical protein